MAPSKKSAWDGEKKINLALQGGGSHGAFTWGVLDAFLEDGRLDIEGITGTSAGAMNAVVLAAGLAKGGRKGARTALHDFWKSVSETNQIGTLQGEIFGAFFKGFMSESSPFGRWMSAVSRASSPYEFNPLNLNPLRDLLANAVDFEQVRACEDIKLFVSATNVHTGKIAIFRRKDLTVEHVLASACLPLVFQAVEIDGVPYWDGGYMGNPALFPLWYESTCPDVLIVQINPIERRETPKTVLEIQNRMSEITFNGMLLRELRTVEFVTRLIDEGKLTRAHYQRPFMHRIDGGTAMDEFSADSRMATAWDFLQKMHSIGHAAGKLWLKEHYADIGKKSTLDLRTAFG